ncbi:MAG TPA: capsule assembly Wzi family protein, partial [Sphingobacterium sp.]|nr:capsule assembly Wzi family protein [Sphingobacterium sp.]
AIQGEWTERKDKAAARWDWGYGVEARTNVGHKAQVQLIDAHVEARYAMFEAKLGRTKDVMGLNGDTLLSSGNFAVSGNALGVPMLDIRIPEYYRLPWWDGLFSLKGNFANGLMGEIPIAANQFLVPTDKYVHPTLLHQKSLYGRIGKPHWLLNLYGGINHQAQWGSEKKVYGDSYTLNNVETLWYVFWGKAYGGGNTPIPRSKLGNQLGSIDLGLSYDWDDVQLMAYRQNFYDVGAISKLANIADGLNGIALTNKTYNKTAKNWDWQKLLFEFFYSKDQAGYPWSKPTASGDEDYYNNYYYTEGWSYKAQGVGSPLIAPAHSVRAGQAHDPIDYFISNRVVAGHIGMRGRLYRWNVTGKLTFARHYGTFATSEYGKSTGGRWHQPQEEKFSPVSQFSALIDAERELRNNLFLGVRLAVDQGQLFDNSVGGQVSLRKFFGKK